MTEWEIRHQQLIFDDVMMKHFHEVYIITKYHKNRISVTEKTFIEHYQTVNVLEDIIERMINEGVVRVGKRTLVRYHERIALMEQYREEAFDFYLANYAKG